jgi:hypothetical protein
MVPAVLHQPVARREARLACADDDGLDSLGHEWLNPNAAVASL